jgi:hypothetical protein
MFLNIFVDEISHFAALPDQHGDTAARRAAAMTRDYTGRGGAATRVQTEQVSDLTHCAAPPRSLPGSIFLQSRTVPNSGKLPSGNQYAVTPLYSRTMFHCGLF